MDCNKNKLILPATFIVAAMNFLLTIMILVDLGMMSHDVDEIYDALDRTPYVVATMDDVFEDD